MIGQDLITHRIVFITGPINEELSNNVISNLLKLAYENNDEPIEIYINSPGGSIDQGLAIIDIMSILQNKYENLHIATVCVGQAEDYHGAAGYVMAKYGRVVSDPALRAILCQEKSTISLEDIMDNGKILLVNLNKSRMGSLSSEWLGMFLLTKIQAAAMQRVDIPERRRRDFYLYIDEFQNSATDNFAEILAESRKYRLNLTLANQYVAQISDNMRKAIFGNVGTLIALRVGQDDAQMLEGQFLPGFTGEDIMRLPNWKGIVASTATGKRLAPFTIDTIPFERETLRTKAQLRKLKTEITARHGEDKRRLEKSFCQKTSGIFT